MPIKYQKFGLRRDKNLSDLNNPRQALGNLLDNLSNEPFIPEDLTQAVSGLRNTTITVDDIQKVKNSVRNYTDNLGNATSFVPLQTVEDNIRNFKVYLGNPPYGGGGDGIDALFVPWDAMDSIWGSANEATKKAWKGNQLFDNNYVAPSKVEPGLEGPFDFWDNGIFVFGSKLYSKFTDTYGLVQWEGYAQGGQSLNMETTGLLKIEVDPLDDGNWYFIKNIYNETRTGIIIASASYQAGDDQTILTLDNSGDHIYICVDDTMLLSGGEYNVAGLSVAGGTITVEGDATANATITYPTTVSFDFNLGGEQVLITGYECRVPNTFVGNLIKTRISYYFPNYGDGRIFPNKRFVDENEDGTERIPYSNFYKAIPSGDPGIYTYEYFEKNRLSKRKKFISPRNGSATTTSLETGKLIYANYTPPSTLGSRYYGSAIAEFDGKSKFTVTGAGLSRAKVGDWIVIEIYSPQAGKQFAVLAIQDRTTNPETGKAEIYVDPDEMDTVATGKTIATSCVVSVYDPLGLIGFVGMTFNSTSGGVDNFSISNMLGQKLSYATMLNDIKNDYFLAGNAENMASGGTISISANKFTYFKRIDIISSGNVNLNRVYGSDSYVPTTGGYIGAVYSHAGLQDLSTINQCAGTYGREVVSQVSSTVIQFTDVSGVTVGDYVQFGNVSGGVTYSSSYISDGVRVQSVDSGTNRVTLDAAVLQSVPQNATVVFISASNWSSNTAKEFCVLPLNTAPPFIGTDAGLRTTSSSAPYSDAANFPNLVTEKLIFAELDLPDVNSLTPLNLSSNPTYGRTMIIDNNGTNYKFLIS